MKLADIIRPEIRPACERLYPLLHRGEIKISPTEIEIFGTRIVFSGNPIPKISVEGKAVVLKWDKPATIDISALPDRLDPTVRKVELHADRAVIFTGYGSVVLKS